jgi:carboxymethylenebutenolidase
MYDAMYDAMMAETIRFTGNGDDEILGYLARPLAAGPFGGVVVIHHMPGYDRSTKEIVRTFAEHGYNALCPNLHHRALPGGDPGEAARLTRESGGVPDEQCVGDVAGAAAVLRALTTSNGKVGVIGYCSGGRQSFLVACRLPLDAAVDCYGGRVAPAPDEIDPAAPPPAVTLTAGLSCPLLGLFGAQDANPSPEQTARIEAALREHDKEYEFHTYDGAGHAFFSVDRPNYSVEAAADGWARIWDFFGRHLAA